MPHRSGVRQTLHRLVPKQRETRSPSALPHRFPGQRVLANPVNESRSAHLTTIMVLKATTAGHSKPSPKSQSPTRAALPAFTPSAALGWTVEPPRPSSGGQNFRRLLQVGPGQEFPCHTPGRLQIRSHMNCGTWSPARSRRFGPRARTHHRFGPALRRRQIGRDRRSTTSARVPCGTAT